MRNPSVSRLIACLSIVAALAQPAALPAQQPGPTRLERQEGAIAAFEAADRESPPAPGGVLFIGSSSIRLWKTLATDFPGLNIISRGFGGSHLPDSTHFADRIVVPYRPHTIVVYAGENDLQSGVSAEDLVQSYLDFVARVHADLPAARIVFIAVKPSPSRAGIFERARRANAAIYAHTMTDGRLFFVDGWNPMLLPDGEPDRGLFVADGVHLSERGYALWSRLVAPFLPAPTATP